MNLNQNQQKFVECRDSNIKLCAVPGSGKTEAIAHRVVNDLACAGFGGRFVVLSYTVAGAEAIKKRLQAMGANPGFVGTLHAWCMRLLEDHGSHIGYGPGLRVLEEQEVNFRLQILASEAGVRNSTQVRKLLGTESTKDGAHVVARKALYEMRRNNTVDFRTALAEALRVMHLTPTLDGLYIDEAQDFADLDFDIFLSAKAKLRVMAGDDDQSIHVWRGAKPDRFINWQATEIQLNINYRSGQNIVKAANALIRHNENRIKKVAEAAKIEPGSVKSFFCEDEFFYSVIANRLHEKAVAGESACLVCRYGMDVDTFKDHIYAMDEEGKLRTSDFHIGTIHSVKGLEFDSVIMIDWHPSDTAEIEEERRLFYTAVTRAKSSVEIWARSRSAMSTLAKQTLGEIL